MTPRHLPPHLWRACRMEMLRRAACMARDMLDYADDASLDVQRDRLESIEQQALDEIAEAGGQYEAAARSLPVQESISAIWPDDGTITRYRRARHHYTLARTLTGAAESSPADAEAWRALADEIAAFIEKAPTPRAG